MKRMPRQALKQLFLVVELEERYPNSKLVEVQVRLESVGEPVVACDYDIRLDTYN